LHGKADHNNIFDAHKIAHQVKDQLVSSSMHIKDALIHVEPFLADQSYQT